MNVERFIGITAVSTAIPIGIVAWGYGVGSPQSPGAGFWPLTIAVVMFGLGLVLILSRGPDGISASGDGNSRWTKLGISLVTLVLYIVFLEPLGYLLTTAIMLLVQLRFVEGRPWRSSILTAILAAVISMLVFKVLLKVSLPLGVIPLPAGW